jgi:inorganic pyrophosphatase
MNYGPDALSGLMGILFRAHPWHGVDLGPQVPELVNTYVEMVPTDTVKYELDKKSGLLKVDRPQKFSSMPPMLYGLIPRTYCGQKVGDYCREKTARTDVIGDRDPLDICILTERPISHGDIIVPAVVVGGFRMIDDNEADDKIIAYMRDDMVYSDWRDISDVPERLMARLRHYFLTYKDIPGTRENVAEITHVYDRQEAFKVIELAQADYAEKFMGIDALRS